MDHCEKMPQNGNGEKTVLVTGASSGIGRAIALAALKAGDYVVATTRKTNGFAQLPEYQDKLLNLKLDVSDTDAQVYEQVVEIAVQKFGRIDVLVNNAGITRDGLLARMKEEAFDRVIEVNLKGAFNCLRHAAPLMMKQRYGRIVSVSSVVGVAGNAGQVNYAASKAGIIGMTKAAAKELAPRGITVNAVAPGFIDTAMTDALPDSAKEAILSRIASGAFGAPEDVANAVAFFAQPESEYITGQVLCIDGGMSL